MAKVNVSYERSRRRNDRVTKATKMKRNQQRMRQFAKVKKNTTTRATTDTTTIAAMMTITHTYNYFAKHTFKTPPG